MSSFSVPPLTPSPASSSTSPVGTTPSASAPSTPAAMNSPAPLAPDQLTGIGPVSSSAAQALPPRAARLTGTLDFSTLARPTLSAAGGLVMVLGASPKTLSPGMNFAWAQALAKDGNLTLRGTHTAEGIFLVEDYCPGISDQFVFGRVDQTAAAAGQAIINTYRGPVEIIDAELKKKFLLAPRLAVILPGDPSMHNGKLVYDQRPAEYYALGRARPNNGVYAAQPVAGVAGRFMFPGDLAYSIFQNKPIYLHSQVDAERINHGQRLWLRGDFRLTADGTSLECFEASYASLSSQDASIVAATTATLLDDAAGAVALQILGFPQVSAAFDPAGFQLIAKAAVHNP